MSQTNIDYLFQLTAAGATRPSDNTRQSVQLPAFNDLFSLASTTTPELGSKTPNYPDRPPQESYAPTNVPTTYDSHEGPPQDPSSSTTDAQVNNIDERAETSGASDQADGNSDRSGDVVATEQSADNDENSSNQDELSELPDEAEQPIAIVASTVTSNPIVDPISVPAATEAEQPASAVAAPSGENATKEQVANQALQTNERTVKLIAPRTAVEVAPAQDAKRGEQSTGNDQTQNSAAPSKPRKSAHAEGASRAVATSGPSENRNAQIAPRHAAANGLPPETQAAVSIDPAGPSDAELPGREPTKDTTTSDEPARRGSGPVTPRAPSRIEAPIPVVSAVAAPQSGGATTPAPENASQRPTNSTAAKADPLVNVWGRHQPGASAVNRARRAAGEDELPRIDPARFIGRVAKAFVTAHERGGTLQLRLSPPELGSLRLELTVKEGVMTAALETETTAARRVLLDHLPALRERLAEQNIRVERFDVDVRRDGGGSQADGRAAQQQQNHQSDQPPPRRETTAQPRTAEAATREAPVILNPINDTRINLVA